ncbi:MAG: MaoC/PaaZ C-terminal domain-containing protein [Hyphomicrobiaceae bacterium]
MTFSYDKIMNWPFKEVEQSYTQRDTLLYALGVGLGYDPLDKQQLNYVFEEADFMAVPTMAVVLAGPGMWSRDPESGIDWKKVLHGEQEILVHKPLPTAATVTATTKVTEILDKGEGKGALIYSSRKLMDKATGDHLATLNSTTFARGNGGFGGQPGPQPLPHPLPERAPDRVCDLPTLPNSALVYRLSGDYNPLHASPDVAEAAGFKAPILHGLCSLGTAGHAILKTYCGYDAKRFRSLKLRFASPVYPGESIRTEMWKDDNVVSFRSKVVERDVVVLSNGRAEVA